MSSGSSQFSHSGRGRLSRIILAMIRRADRVKVGCMTGGLGAVAASDHDHVWHSASY